VVDEELRAPAEEIRQRGIPLVGVESIGLVDPHPRQILPPPRQLVAAPGVLLLRLEQIETRVQPLLACSGPVLGHCSSLLARCFPYDPVIAAHEIDLPPESKR